MAQSVLWFLEIHETSSLLAFGERRIIQQISASLCRMCFCCTFAGEEGQDSDIQTMRSEEDVAEEFGSWQEYMELQRQIWTQSGKN